MIIPGSPEMKSQLEAVFDLEISVAMFKETAKQYSHVDRVIPESEWMKRAPYVHAINKIKKEKDAVIFIMEWQILLEIVCNLQLKQPELKKVL
jgi:quinolinate synthase